jgi:hypothetical protein
MPDSTDLISSRGGPNSLYFSAGINAEEKSRDSIQANFGCD